MAYYASLSRSSSGGGLNVPTSIWYGTLAEYAALSSKDDNMLYVCRYNGLVPSALYIGNTQISPINHIALDYPVFVDKCTVTFYCAVDTGFHWADGSDFEIEFSLGQSSYGNTLVLFSNSNRDWNFNLILNGAEMKLYDSTHNQSIIDTTISVDVPYYIRRNGSNISIYKEDSLLVTTNAPSNILSTTLSLFSWGTTNYFSGKINYIKANYVN